jgi:GNAT superfamily N-acetyltransferase
VLTCHWPPRAVRHAAGVQRIAALRRQPRISPRGRAKTLASRPERALYSVSTFLVSEDETNVQGFTCANHQTGYVWALFVIDEAQGRGHGTALLDAAMARLRRAGHRQAFLSTERGTRAVGFYLSRGWQPTGVSMKGEVVFRLWL